MPLYDMKNTETGEVKEMFLSLSKREDFLKDNPQWVQLPSAMTVVYDGYVDNLTRAGSGWNDLIKEVKKGSGKDNTIKTK